MMTQMEVEEKESNHILTLTKGEKTKQRKEVEINDRRECLMRRHVILYYVKR